MTRSDLIIAGSNFIFSHIKQNYSKYLNDKKKLMVIFRGINVDYFDPTTKFESDEKKLLTKWNIEKDKKIILLPGRLTSWKGQEVFIEAINLVNIELGYEAFYAVILGSDQGRDLYKKKLIRLSEQYRLTNQIRFIDHCKDMALAYKVSDIVVSASSSQRLLEELLLKHNQWKNQLLQVILGVQMKQLLMKKQVFYMKQEMLNP